MLSNIQKVYRKLFTPILFFTLAFCPHCQLAILRLCEFQSLKLSLFKHGFVWGIQGRAKPFPIEEGRKYHRAKITLHIV